MLKVEYELKILEFKMRMLQAEIEMQGMVAENKKREMLGQSMAYTEADFLVLITQHRIHAGAIPTYKGME